MKPTCRFWLWQDSVEVLLFGKGTGDWRLQGSTPDEVEQNNPGVLARLEEVFNEFPRFQFYAPRPLRFNAEIVHPNDLDESWINRLWRGREADGVVLQRPHQGFLIASADCPTLICRDKPSGRVIAAHAGRDCLFDRNKLLTGQSSRRVGSVVESIVKQIRPRDLSLWVSCGITPANFPHSWDHPIYGKQNKEISLFFGNGCLFGDPALGQINIRAVIKKQLVGLHVPHWLINGDHIDTYSDMDPDRPDKYRWHSARRDGPGAGRNLVVVLRHK